MLKECTPGPWREFMGDICAQDDEIVIAGMNKSCGARSSEYSTFKAKHPAAKANARLIAAAPEMALFLWMLASRKFFIWRSENKWHIAEIQTSAAWALPDTGFNCPALPPDLFARLRAEMEAANG